MAWKRRDPSRQASGHRVRGGPPAKTRDRELEAGSAAHYEDPAYYLSKDLVRPYRVAMSCAFCHVGPNPLKPPADPENPRKSPDGYGAITILLRDRGAEVVSTDAASAADAAETPIPFRWPGVKRQNPS